jgi:threonine dehydratase
MQRIEPLTIDDVRAARERIGPTVTRTPLIRFQVDGPGEIWLKLETLQPIGSFKLRGAMNAIRLLPPFKLSEGVYTASAGNMAQGVAWGARALGIPCTVIMPDSAPKTKLDAVARLGATIATLPYDD